MSAELVEHVGPWTVEDVEALPHAADHSRYELLATGVLTVSPAPGTMHQRASRKLANLLEAAAAEAEVDVEVLEAVNIEVPGGRLAVPDIVLVDRALAATNPTRCPAEGVRLVVEIVSPGSEPQDRLVKPHLYADAGIAVYWRFELAPVPQIVATEPGSQLSTEVTALAGSSSTLMVPFPVTLDPGELVDQ